MRLFLLTLLSLVSLPVRAQSLADVMGIRAGVVAMSPALVRRVNDLGLGMGQLSTSFPVTVQVGTEARFDMSEPQADGTTVELSFFGLAAGVERRVLDLSVAAVVGICTARGVRVGAGPTLALTDTGVLLVAGVERRAGSLRLPADVALGLTTGGIRVSVLVGVLSDGRLR